jgi:hypothetical protein
LFDSTLIKLAETEFVWCLVVHHLIGDGWSFELIYRHMADLYRRLCARGTAGFLKVISLHNYVSMSGFNGIHSGIGFEARTGRVPIQTGDETAFMERHGKTTTASGGSRAIWV